VRTFNGVVEVNSSKGLVGLVFVAIQLLLLSACQSSGGVLEQLDEQSSVTWTAETAAATFARTDARYSRSARDYLYLGPVATNRRGAVEYFLWVGTTLDREYLDQPSMVPNRLVVYVDGEPLEWGLAPWADRVPDMRGSDPYVPTVPLQMQLAARVTVDQLRLLSERRIDSVRIGGVDSTMQAFFPWNEWIGWPTFLGRAGGLR